MISFLEFFIYICVGVVAGFLSGLLGVGGGLIVVPSLVAIFHLLNFSPENVMQMAIGTSLAAMIFTSGTSAWAHLKGINWSVFKTLVPGICLGSLVGAMIAHILPAKQLQIVFGALACLFGCYFLMTAKVIGIERNIKPHFLSMILIGITIGIISSILGVGGGIITVPALTFFGLSLRSAISTSAATGFLIAVGGSLSFLYLGLKQEIVGGIGYIYVPAFILIGLSAAMTAPIGAKYAYSTSIVILKRIFGFYLILLGIIMIW